MMMRTSARLAFAFTLTVLGCGDSGKGGTPPVTPGPTTGNIAGVATLGGMTAGNSGIVVGVLGGPAALTDDNGNYAIAGVAPGAVTIVAEHAGYMSATTSVTVTAGQTATAPPLNLTALTPATGGVTGKVLLFDSANAAGSMVSLSGSGGTATSAADGTYSITNVPAGSYDATFTHAGGYVSQTVHNVVVTSGGTFTVPLVTLRRNVTTIGGHTITDLGPSPDWSERLLLVDNDVEVASEASGAAVVVSAGTTANFGAISGDNRHVWLNDTNNHTSFLWLGPAGGATPPALVTATYDSQMNNQAQFSPDGSHLFFYVLNATSGQDDAYIMPSTGGAPTLLASGVSEITRTTDGGTIFLTNNAGTDANGNGIEDVFVVNTNGGTVQTLASVVQSRIRPIFNSGGLSAYVFLTSTGTVAYNGGNRSTGDLYAWQSGAATATKLSAAPFDSLATIFVSPFMGAPNHVWVSPLNFDTDQTWANDVIDFGTLDLRTLVAHTKLQSPMNGLFGFFPVSTTVYKTDQHNNAGVYTNDLVMLDFAKATVTMVQANAAPLFGSNTIGANDSPGRYMQFAFANTPFPFDFNHLLFASAHDANNLLTVGLWDGAYAHLLNDPATPTINQSALGMMRFSPDYRVVVYVSPGPGANETPLTIANLPASGTAGNAVVVPLAASVFPSLPPALSLDGKKVAYVTTTTAYTLPTAASATPVAATLAYTDPNAQPFSWLAISGKGDLVFAGDAAASPAVNGWAIVSPTNVVALDSANLGNSTPRVFSLADGMRSFVVFDATPALYQIDTAATPVVTKDATYATNSALTNLASSRFFYQTGAPALVAVSSTGAAITTAGTYNNLGAPLSPWLGNQQVTYFRSSTNALIAFDGGTGAAVPLATNTGGLSPIFFFNGTTFKIDLSAYYFIDTLASSERDLVLTKAAAPGRIVLSHNYTGGGLAPFANPTTMFYSPDFGTLYAFDNPNPTANPLAFNLNAYQLGGGTMATIGSNLPQNPNVLTFDTTGKNLLFSDTPDALLGTYSLFSTPTNALTKITVASNVIGSVSSAPANGNLAGLTLTNGVSTAWSAAPAAASVALSSLAVSVNTNFAWSADSSHVFAVDSRAQNYQTGYAFAAMAGSGGAEIDTDVFGAAMPNFTGSETLLIAQHGTTVGFTLDQVNTP